MQYCIKRTVNKKATDFAKLVDKHHPDKYPYRPTYYKYEVVEVFEEGEEFSYVTLTGNEMFRLRQTCMLTDEILESLSDSEVAVDAYNRLLNYKSDLLEGLYHHKIIQGLLVVKE